MAYGLPSRGQSDWDDELNNSMEALHSDVQSATANATVAVSNASQAITIAQDAAARVEQVSGLSGEDAAVAALQEDDDSATAVATDARVETKVAADVANSASAIGGALSATYARVVQIVADGTDQTADINAALAAGWLFGDYATVRLVGEFTITTTLIVPSKTTLDARDATITLGVGANCRMVQNAAAFGVGARDTDVHIVGGFWDRGAVGGGAVPVAGGTATDTTHSILLHRVDRCSVTDIRFNATGVVKFSIWLADVTSANVERCDITSTSDGVHVVGPSSYVTIRDIAGDTDDDLISLTGRDYTGYEPTAGGGDISNIVIERICLRSGDGNTVKLLPGALMTMSAVVVRNISGDPTNSAVTLYSDEVFASTTGGTIKDVLIDGVSGNPAVGTGFLVNIRHGDVQGLKIRNVNISNQTTRGVAFFVPGGGTCTDAVIDGITTTVPYTSGSAIHVGTSYIVSKLKVSNANIEHTGSGNGWLVNVSGTIGVLQMHNITQTLGRAVVDVTGACPLIITQGLYSTAQYGLYVNANVTVEWQLTGLTGVPTARLVWNNHATGSALLRASGITGTATSHMGKVSTGPLRAVGAEIRCDVSTLTPVAGDMAHNTNAALACGTGPVISNGTLWKHLYTGATT